MCNEILGRNIRGRGWLGHGKLGRAGRGADEGARQVSLPEGGSTERRTLSQIKFFIHLFLQKIYIYITKQIHIYIYLFCYTILLKSS